MPEESKKIDFEANIDRKEDKVTHYYLKVGNDSLKMVPVFVENPELAKFNDQGKATGENGVAMDAVPYHHYMISDKPVTVKIWNSIMGTHLKGDDLPVLATKLDIDRFIQKLNEKCGQVFRLPTLEEWRFAAKGGLKSKGLLYAGSQKCSDVACFWGNSANRRCKVASYKPNELDLYDMSGNVWEICENTKESKCKVDFIEDIKSRYVICGGNCKSLETQCTTDSIVQLNFMPTHRCLKWRFGNNRWVYFYRKERNFFGKLIRLWISKQKDAFWETFGFRLAITVYPDDLNNFI